MWFGLVVAMENNKQLLWSKHDEAENTGFELLGSEIGSNDKIRSYTQHMLLLEGQKAKASHTDGPTDGRTHALIESLRRD